MKLIDCVELDLGTPEDIVTLYIDVFDNSLSRKWLNALTNLVANEYHLEKNYCFLGFANSERNGELILSQVNSSIEAINAAGLGYAIDDSFSLFDCVEEESRKLKKDHLNKLHRYFEDLQGVSGRMSQYYNRATPRVRWHIRQLNLLCHEFESWALSYRKQIQAPEWQRPSQLMCWLNAPRFTLDEQDYELFGVETINRSTGGVFVGVNKAVGKHHWEVFCDEGRDSRVGELVTSSMRSQTEAAGDFDIEWGKNPAEHAWQRKLLMDFRTWLTNNGFDPNDRSLTIGHPQVAQVNLRRSFGTDNINVIWQKLNSRLNVYAIRASGAQAVYKYHWADADYTDQQIYKLQQGH